MAIHRFRSVLGEVADLFEASQAETQVCGPWFVTDLTIKMIYAIDHL